MQTQSTTPTEDQRAAEAAIIAAQNDTFRAELGEDGPGILYATPGVLAEGPAFVTEAIARVRSFAAFTAENDPYGDHSFGAMTVEGVAVWWKIDLYDRDTLHGAPEPTDPARTRRVLTILLPAEY